MLMPSTRIIDPQLLYLVALMWNLITIGYIVVTSLRASRIADPLTQQIIKARRILEDIRFEATEAGSAGAAIDRDVLEKISSFARNPRAFGYDHKDTEDLLNKVRAQLRQETQPAVEASQSSGHANISEAIRSAMHELSDGTPHVIVSGNRILATLVVGDLVILGLIIFNFLAK
jgi:hypothetical protein